MQWSLSRHVGAKFATAPRVAAGAPAFVVIANGAPRAFSIDDDAFAGWLAVEGDELQHIFRARSNRTPGQIVSDLAYRALSAAVLVGDPRIELNVHGCVTEETGYVVRLNNRGGHQQLVGLVRGWHELRWPPSDLTLSEEVRCYLQQICDVANTILNDVRPTALSIGSIGGT
ncbi:hypothetical protein [Mycobacterium decipiens]|nr:hypothetical protein [Mycobacterium decipiens]